MKIVVWVLMGLGVLFLGIGLWLLTSAFVSTSWPTVDGQVVETKIVARIGDVGKASVRHIIYSVEVTYEYEVNQVTHRSKRYSLGDGDTVAGGFNEKAAARDWLKNSVFHDKPVVKVYVNPSDPNDTVLSSGIKWSTFMPMVLGLMLVIMGYLMRKYLIKV